MLFAMARLRHFYAYVIDAAAVAADNAYVTIVTVRPAV